MGDIDDRLSNMFKGLFFQSEQTIEGYKSIAQSHGWSVHDDIGAYHKGGDGRVGKAVRRVNELEREVQSYKKLVGYTWADFVAAANQKIDTSRSTWRKYLVAHLPGIGVSDLITCERMNLVPPSYMLRVAELGDLRSRAKTMDAEVTNFVKDCHYKLGVPFPVLARVLSKLTDKHVTEGQLMGRVHSARPINGTIGPADSDAPLERVELELMGDALFGKSNHRKVRNFFGAHLPFDIEEARAAPLTPDKAREARKLYWREIVMRKKNAAYEAMSIEFALIPRPKPHQAPLHAAGMSKEEFRQLGEYWFGSDVQECMALLTGYSSAHIRRTLSGTRPISESLETFLRAIAQAIAERADISA